MKEKSSEKIERAGAILRLIVLVSLFVFIIFNYRRLANIDVRVLLDKIDDRFLAGGVVLSVYVLKGLAMVVPAILIYVSVGASFNVFTGIALNCIGVFMELSTAYFLGRFLGGEYINNALKKQKYGQKILELSDKKRCLAIFIFRAIPVFPLDFISLFLGSRKISFVKYTAYSLLGVLPRVIIFSVLGYKIFDYISMKFIIMLIAIILPVAITVFAVKEIIKLKNKK